MPSATVPPPLAKKYLVTYSCNLSAYAPFLTKAFSLDGFQALTNTYYRIKLKVLAKKFEMYNNDSVMAIERTLSIIKPDAVAKHVIGQIYTLFEEAKLFIIAAKMLHLSKEQAASFYAVHQERPFFDSLVEFMTSGNVMIQVLEGENAVKKHRQLMGATDPKEAAPGTIRSKFADSIDANAVHGSDSLITANQEINFFFPDLQEKL